MATRFTYFGFEYEVLEDKKNEVALIDASNAKGRTIIPKEVEYNGHKYVVTQITGKKVHFSYLEQPEDRRKKPITKYDDAYRGAFSNKRHDGKSWNGGFCANENPLDVVIPEGVTSIGKEAFCNCSGMTHVSIPNSVTSIGYGAFFKCSGLNSVTIPEKVISIGEFAFSCCTSLTNITIPSSVKTIAQRAFAPFIKEEMKLEKVMIENEEGKVIIHPNAFEPKVKIEYAGKPKTKPTKEHWWKVW